MGSSLIRGLRIVAPTQTTILPPEYTTDDLFKDAAAGEGKA
jgi:hypothetical protein